MDLRSHSLSLPLTLEWRCSGCNCRQTVPRRLEITSATGLQVACDSCQSKFYSYVANVQQVSDAAFNQNITNSTSSSSELEPIPQWLASELAKYRSKYPADIIEVVRKGGEWRFKCTDCIGKLYSVGPGQTMGNFELHLKNRKHRDAVSKRMWVVPMATGHK